MTWLQTIAREFGLSLANPSVWAAVAQGLVIASACLLFGIWATRRVGLLEREAPAAETVGIGLSTGVLVMVAWWAAIASGGRSSFTPVAIGFAIAIVVAVYSGRRAPDRPVAQRVSESGPTRAVLRVALAGGIILVLAAHLYGATMALSPRDGVQPLEFMDEAFYSILASDLASTGVETTMSPAGYDAIPGTPPQNWYHWGEIWLASAAIVIFDTAPVAARHFIALPMTLLAACLLTGTIVRRALHTTARGALIIGMAICAFLAPLPWLDGPWFSSWAVGMTFGVTLYGLGAVAVLLGIYVSIVPRDGSGSWGLALFSASALAAILPTHLILAMLSVLGALAVVAWMAVRHRDELPGIVPRAWRRTIACGVTLAATTAIWGLLTGHALGGSGASAGVEPFNHTWRNALATIAVGAGILWATPVAVFALSRDSASARLYVASIVVVVAGAIAWGARLADFNMFHVFFGGVAVFGSAAAATAIWALWERISENRHRNLVIAAAVFAVAQLEVGAVLTIGRLQTFGPGMYPPVPLEVIEALKALPEDAKIAYSCAPTEEVAYWDARLLSIAAHSHRRVMPLCFQADSFAPLVGAAPDLTMSPLFATAPHRSLFPTADARPTADDVADFLRKHAIGYIYEDRLHPNDLTDRTSLIFQVDDVRLHEVQ